MKNRQSREEWESFFDFSPKQIRGTPYHLSPEDLASTRHQAYSWHAAGDPSTWLSVMTFHTIRKKYPELSERDHLEITSHALGIRFKRLIELIEWRDNYLTFREGVEEKTLKGKY